MSRSTVRCRISKVDGEAIASTLTQQTRPEQFALLVPQTHQAFPVLHLNHFLCQQSFIFSSQHGANPICFTKLSYLSGPQASLSFSESLQYFQTAVFILILNPTCTILGTASGNLVSPARSQTFEGLFNSPLMSSYPPQHQPCVMPLSPPNNHH